MAAENQPLSQPPVATVPLVEAEIEDTEVLTDEVDELSEQLAAHSILSEERHDAIITEVNECRTRLDQLSNRLTETGESPQLSLILAEVTKLNTRLETLETNLKSLQDTSQQTRTQSESMPPNSVDVAVRAEAVPVVEVPAVSVPPKRKRHVL